MTITAEVNALSDDQALLIQWVRITLEEGLYRDRPKMAELLAITLYTLVQAIPPSNLRNNLDISLRDLRITIRGMRDALDRRTH